LPVASPRRRAIAGPAPVRLTRRGRLVVRGLLVLGVLLVMVGLAAAASASAPGAAPHGPPPSVVVRPGDTRWNIATRQAPGAAPNATIEEIRRLNHLDDSVVEVGQRLLLPAR